MLLTQDDGLKVLTLLTILDAYTHQKFVNQKIKKVVYDFSHDERFELRKYLYKNTHLIDEFIQNNYYELSADDIAVIAAWKKINVRGDFIILSYTDNHGIFYKNNAYYAVKAISTPFNQMFTKFPVQVKTMILPYADYIICDGILQMTPLFYSKTVKDALIKEYENSPTNHNFTLTTVNEQC